MRKLLLKNSTITEINVQRKESKFEPTLVSINRDVQPIKGSDRKYIHLSQNGVKIMCRTQPVAQLKLDVDPQRDDDASPMSTCRCMLRPI